MFIELETTFGAFANVARPYIQDTISETPPTLEVGTDALPTIRPFLDNSAQLFNDLSRAIDALEKNSDAIAGALEVGAPILRRSVIFNNQLGPTAAALRSLNDDAGARAGIDRLRETHGHRQPDPRLHHPRTDHLQLRRDPLRQPPEPVQPGDRARHLAASRGDHRSR